MIAKFCQLVTQKVVYLFLVLVAMLLSFGYTQALHRADLDLDSLETEHKSSAASIEIPQAPDARPAEFAALIERPLFLESRTRPLSPTGETSPLPADKQNLGPSPDYVIAGIVVSPTRRRVLMRAPGEEAGKWWNQGETTANGWAIVSVEGNSVVLASGPNKHTFVLHGSKQH